MVGTSSGPSLLSEGIHTFDHRLRGPVSPLTQGVPRGLVGGQGLGEHLTLSLTVTGDGHCYSLSPAGDGGRHSEKRAASPCRPAALLCPTSREPSAAGRRDG